MGSEGDDDVGGCVMTLVAGVLLVVASVVLGVTGGVSLLRDRDLRDLSGLTRTTAQVVDVDQGGKYGRDEYEVSFRSADGRRVRTEVPVDVATSSQRQVEVAYDADDPTRVRTVEDWLPWYRRALTLWVISLAVAPVLVLWEATRGLRRRARRRLRR